MKDLLSRIVVAAPCPRDWNSMQGDDKVRHCSGCSKNVYNISAMGTKEAEQFLQANGVEPCVRLFRRQDGTILTDNCPMALRKLRNKLKTILAAISGIIFALLSIEGPASAQGAYSGANGGIRPMRSEDSVIKNGTYQNGNTPQNNNVQACNSPIISKPQNGDTRAFDLWQQGRESSMHKQYVLAQTYYKQALNVARDQKNADLFFQRQIESDIHENEANMRQGEQTKDTEVTNSK